MSDTTPNEPVNDPTTTQADGGTALPDNVHITVAPETVQASAGKDGGTALPDNVHITAAPDNVHITSEPS
jgi:hypothetical protein